tara:strand:+ start:3418 stop:4131 length:714 start_codon:yes stop_codon:yes gene_type:complete
MKKHVIILLALTIQMVAAAPQTSRDVRNKLESILVKKLEPLNGFTIEELMPLLYKLSVDSKGQGINFIFNQNVNKAQEAPATQQLPIIDPVTGLPQQPLNINPPMANSGGGVAQPFNPAAPMPPAVSLPMGGIPLNHLAFQPPAQAEKDIKIKGLSVPLHNLSLKQVLDVCVMSFNPPMTYAVMDYGVIFMRRDESKPLYIYRTFRVNGSRLIGFPTLPARNNQNSRTNSVNNGQIR